ncbi:CRE-IRK-2 protein [Caenorhabditis remanei]|uniref:CRE-IRK-2 protein n=1 Tax=Caenorhabditis remanei TaxID=31234 RepID=E3MA81_CAERE|nr:CRE-IRK-2 protein [Caenorhabditis remanei]
MIKRCVTYEGELLPFHQFDMDVGYDQGLDRVFVIWPITICHEIDERSPLWEIGADDLKSAKFEIIGMRHENYRSSKSIITAILEGVVESVGSTTQARTSYLPSEILWGHRFEKLVHYKKENGQYNIDFGKFHNVYSVNTPTCSAAEIERLRSEGTFNESEYQMYPPSDNKLNLLDNDEMSPVRDSMDLSNQVPQIQILRRDSDEDPDAGEESMELVDLGIHHKCSIRSQSPIINSTAHLLQPMHKNSCSVRRGMLAPPASHS